MPFDGPAGATDDIEAGRSSSRMMAPTSERAGRDQAGAAPADHGQQAAAR